MLACQGGHLEVVRLLLERGAAVDAKDGDMGETPLMKACYNGHVEAARLLLEKSADVNVADMHGQTSLMFGRHAYYVDHAPTEEAKAQLRALLA